LTACKSINAPVQHRTSQPTILATFIEGSGQCLAAQLYDKPTQLSITGLVLRQVMSTTETHATSRNATATK